MYKKYTNKGNKDTSTHIHQSEVTLTLYITQATQYFHRPLKKEHGNPFNLASKHQKKTCM